MVEPLRHSETEVELIRRIRRGDSSALEQLFCRYHRNLVNFARSYVRNAAVAEEIVQDLYFNIWRNRDTWDPRDSLTAYLYGAVRNNATSYSRRKKVRTKWESRERISSKPFARVTSGPDLELEFQEMVVEIERVIEEMPPKRRLVFSLSRHQGLSYAEIAAALDISVKTVEVHMSKALKLLRVRLAPLLSRTRNSNER